MEVKLKTSLMGIALHGTLALLAACVSQHPEAPLPPPSMAPAATATVNPLTFQPGDTVELFVKEDPTLNGVYPVRDGGYIVIPRAGRIMVVGLERAAAEAKVKDTLQRTQLKEATVLLERSASRTAMAGSNVGGPPGIAKMLVYVTGSVARSGAHYLAVPNGRPLGVYEALLITGGVSKFGQEQRVEVFRADASGKRHRALVDLRAVRQGSAEDPPVGEGDIIFVPEKVFGF